MGGEEGRKWHLGGSVQLFSKTNRMLLPSNKPDVLVPSVGTGSDSRVTRARGSAFRSPLTVPLMCCSLLPGDAFLARSSSLQSLSEAAFLEPCLGRPFRTHIYVSHLCSRQATPEGDGSPGLAGSKRPGSYAMGAWTGAYP